MVQAKLKFEIANIIQGKLKPFIQKNFGHGLTQRGE